VKILTLFDSIKPGSELIIQILELIDTLSEQGTILPELLSVNNDAYDAGRSCRPSLLWLRLYGVAYLPRLRIIHWDIKPTNLAVNEMFRLKIVDFAIQLNDEDEDEMVDDHCGTDDWVAPEMNVNVN
jgi:serine/threonine protein kinase